MKRRLIGITLILTALCLFLFFPAGFHRWGYVVTVINVALVYVGWRIFGSAQQNETTSKNTATESIRRLNLPFLLGGVLLLIVAVALAFFIEKLELPRDNQTWLFVLMVIGVGLILLSGLRA